jgi:imidazole glycerol-phosphate synthase subunit HisH
MIAVVDYGMGNLHSVRHALDMVGADVCITRLAEDLRSAERIILPGVGAFAECARNLRATGLVEVLEEEVMQRAKPFFGICVGLQVLAREGHEMGVYPGLDWFPAVVKRFQLEDSRLKVPHVGWNEVILRKESPLFKGLNKLPEFYFVHSYHLVCEESDSVLADCDYGGPFTAALQRDNIFATQFHPEKSQQNGLRLLENFLNWNP